MVSAIFSREICSSSNITVAVFDLKSSQKGIVPTFNIVDIALSSLPKSLLANACVSGVNCFSCLLGYLAALDAKDLSTK